MKIILVWLGLSLATAGFAADPAASALPRKPSPEQVQAERDRLMQEVLATIAGREDEPAEQVFENITLFKGMPAARLLRVMDQGFGRALGVDCTHCHVPGDWARDKLTKEVARDMWELTARLNREQLPLIKNLESENPVVNCTTCHRGEVKPATDLRSR
jgi:hypothetical protein